MSDFSTVYEDYHNELLTVIKNYKMIIKQLQSLLILRKDLQEDILNSMLHIDSEAQELVRDVIENDINITSIKKHNMMIEEQDNDNEE
jgi:hypothetical protein